VSLIPWVLDVELLSSTVTCTIQRVAATARKKSSTVLVFRWYAVSEKAFMHVSSLWGKQVQGRLILSLALLKSLGFYHGFFVASLKPPSDVGCPSWNSTWTVCVTCLALMMEIDHPWRLGGIHSVVSTFQTSVRYLLKILHLLRSS
jgi:hypothetical protein